MSQRAIRKMPMIITIMGHHGKEMSYNSLTRKLKPMSRIITPIINPAIVLPL